MTDGHSPTLLDELMRRRMWGYARFAREYRKAAERLGVPAHPPEERQLKRWRSGRVERPRSAACEVLEELFGQAAPELLAPPRSRPAGAAADEAAGESMGEAADPCAGPFPGPGAGPEPVAAIEGTVTGGAQPVDVIGIAYAPPPTAADPPGPSGPRVPPGPLSAGRRPGRGAVGLQGPGAGGGEYGARRPRRSALRLIGGGAMAPLLEAGPAAAGALGRAVSSGQCTAEALSWSRELERTDVGPGTLAHLEAAVDRLCHGYAELPPDEASQLALLYRRQVAALMSGRHTMREARELARCAGLLSVVLGWLAHDLGETVAAEAYCLDARLHGEHAELPEVCAWAEDCRSTVALYAERPEIALSAALRGRAYAPAGTRAEVRLVGQVARACARSGRADEFRVVMAEARGFQDRLPAHAVGLFSADAARISSFEASGQRMLGRPDRARRAAEEALRQYREAGVGAPGGAAGSPTRLAIALLDLAGARAAEGELEGAVEAGREALRSPRPAEAINVRAAQLAKTLLSTYRGARAAKEFAGLARRAAAPRGIG
ncbi:hypothetical protein [Phaeacidiphilus oryzae]|uniref:hypothetical protein n=1 Tax=Phaeacidiphilus oryzae TaxID=348818 RepID=UPI00055FF208|nr:hypothetical protein [Phaeacidiphilus oryzae]